MTVDQITISRFSAISRLAQKALRYYDERGLLVPGAKDPYTGYRYYTADQLGRAVQIKTLTMMGFGVEEIAELLKAEDKDDMQAVEHMVRKRLERTREEVERLRQ